MKETTTATDSIETSAATGPVWSAILAAGVGCGTLGILTILTEVSARISHAMTFSRAVGDLSGVTTLSLSMWLLSWRSCTFDGDRDRFPRLDLCLSFRSC